MNKDTNGATHGRRRVQGLLTALKSICALSLATAAWFAARMPFVFLEHVLMNRLEKGGRAVADDQIVDVLAWIGTVIPFGVAGFVAARLAPGAKLLHSMVLALGVISFQAFVVIGHAEAEVGSQFGLLALLGAASIAFAAIGGWLGRFVSPQRSWEEYGQPMLMHLANGSTVEVRSARRSLVAAAAVYLLALVLPILFMSVIALIFPLEEGIDSTVLQNQFAVIVLAVSVGLFSVARRMHSPSIKKTLSGRLPPVLYLRSFRDDDTELPREAYDFGEKNAGVLLCKVLRRLGPVIAIGRPGETLPPAGATRLYVQNVDWQATVEDLLKRSKLVVLRIADTEGVKWELRACLARTAPDRLLLFAQRRMNMSRHALYESYREWANDIFPHPLPKQLDDACFIYFRDDWRPVAIPRNSSPESLSLPHDHVLAPVVKKLSSRELFYFEPRPGKPIHLVVRVLVLVLCFAASVPFFVLGGAFAYMLFSPDRGMAMPMYVELLLAAALLAIGVGFVWVGWRNRKGNATNVGGV